MYETKEIKKMILAMLSFRDLLSLVVVSVTPPACLSTVVQSSFTILNDQQLPRSLCVSLSGSLMIKRGLTCAMYCAHTSVCEGFNFRCLDLGLPTVFCQCELCSSLYMGVPLPANGTTAGVVQSQTKDGFEVASTLEALTGTTITTSTLRALVPTTTASTLGALVPTTTASTLEALVPTNTASTLGALVPTTTASTSGALVPATTASTLEALVPATTASTLEALIPITTASTLGALIPTTVANTTSGNQTATTITKTPLAFSVSGTGSTATGQVRSETTSFDGITSATITTPAATTTQITSTAQAADTTTTAADTTTTAATRETMDTQGEDISTVTTTLTTQVPPCGLPPLIARTIVKYTWTDQRATAAYRCSDSTDVYVRGTTEVYCASGSNWPWASILCAPTTCFYNRHYIWGPVYAGTLVKTGCQSWSSNVPRQKSDLYNLNSAYRSDNDNILLALDYCRIFDDGWNFTWCYNGNPMGSSSWIQCNVPACPDLPGQLDPTSDSPGLTPAVPPCGYPPLIARTTVNLKASASVAKATYRCSVTSDIYIRGTTNVSCTAGSTWPRATILCAPTTCYHNRNDVWGPVYAGTANVTASNERCRAWTSDSPWPRGAFYTLALAYRSDNDSITSALNYCRIFDDETPYTWCYINTVPPYWEKCDVPECPDVPGDMDP